MVRLKAETKREAHVQRGMAAGGERGADATRSAQHKQHGCNYTRGVHAKLGHTRLVPLLLLLSSHYRPSDLLSSLYVASFVRADPNT